MACFLAQERTLRGRRRQGGRPHRSQALLRPRQRRHRSIRRHCWKRILWLVRTSTSWTFTWGRRRRPGCKSGSLAGSWTFDLARFTYAFSGHDLLIFAALRIIFRAQVWFTKWSTANNAWVCVPCSPARTSSLMQRCCFLLLADLSGGVAVPCVRLRDAECGRCAHPGGVASRHRVHHHPSRYTACSALSGRVRRATSTGWSVHTQILTLQAPFSRSVKAITCALFGMAS